MKSILKILGLFILTAMVACGDDDASDGGLGENASCEISWKVDGVSDSEEPLICVYVDNTLNIGLTGSNQMQLQVNDLTQPGTFDLADQGSIIILELDNGEKLGSNIGQIIITEISSTKAKGTFSGTFFPVANPSGTTYAVTDGKFTANF